MDFLAVIRIIRNSVVPFFKIFHLFFSHKALTHTYFIEASSLKLLVASVAGTLRGLKNKILEILYCINTLMPGGSKTVTHT